jgi:1,2-diacylglycerol 3-alpha-glucosyltransferase
MKSETDILLLTPGFSSGSSDSTTIPSLQHYVRCLKQNYPQYRIHVLSFQYPYKTGEYDWNGIPVYSAGGRNRKRNRLLTWMKILRRMMQLRRSYRADIVHAFWLTETAFIGLLFRWFSGTPLLITAMGQDVKHTNRYLRLLKWFPLDLVYLSKYQAGVAPHLKFRKQYPSIPFGVDPQFFHPDEQERMTDILCVGSLNKIKNHTEAVKIISEVSEHHPFLSCKFIGEGSEEADIRKQIREMRLEKNILLAGSFPYSETIREMHTSRILLHTSLFEGQGLVITEALAAGLYVVCYPVGIACEIISERLLTGTTREELVRHILTLLSANQFLNTSEYHYTIADTCRDYDRIYREMNGER